MIVLPNISYQLQRVTMSTKERKAVIQTIALEYIEEVNKCSQARKKGRIINSILNSYKDRYPWLTVLMLKGKVQRLRRKKVQDPPPPGVITTDTACTRKKRGRPQKTAALQLKKLKVQGKNDIMEKWMTEVRNRKGGDTQKALFNKAVMEVKEKLSLPVEFNFSYRTAQARRNRKDRNVIVPYGCGNGTGSPLAGLESDVVEVIIMMASIRQPLNPSQGLALLNSMMEGTCHQEKLIRWKKVYHPDSTDLGYVTHSYWQGFMRRNGDRIVSKKGQKFALDRSISMSSFRNSLVVLDRSNCFVV